MLQKNGFYFLKKADFAIGGIEKTEYDDRLIHKLAEQVFDDNSIELKQESLGTFHNVYSIKSGGRDYYLKAAVIERFADSLRKEKFIYDFFISKIFPELCVVTSDFSKSIYPFSYIIMTSAEGMNMRSIDIDRINYGNIVENAGNVLKSVYTYIECKGGAGEPDLELLENEKILQGCFPAWKDFFYFNLDEHIEFAFRKKTFSQETLLFIRQIFKDTELTITQRPANTLLHGDPGSHNIFVGDNDSITAIIDWEDAIIGDYLFDLAMFTTFFRMTEFTDRLFEGADTQADKDTLLLVAVYRLRILLAKVSVRFKLGYDTIDNNATKSKISDVLKEIESLENKL